MNSTRFACVLAATVLVLGVACGGGSAPEDEPAPTAATGGGETTVVAEPTPPPPPPPRPVPVRVLHLAAGLSTASVAATAGPPDSPLAQVDGVAFRGASAYAELTSAEGTVPVTVSAGEASASFDAPVRPGVPATVIVVSNPQDPAQIVVTATEDDAQAVTGQLRGRFVNALLGTEAIDFCLPGDSARAPGRPIFTNVQYGQVAGTATANHYIPVPLTGGATIQVRAGAENGCTGRVIGSAAVPPPDGSVPHNLTLAVIGRTTGRPRVAAELLVCEDAPGESSCSALPLRAR